MKTPINFLKLIFSFSILTLIYISCAKEEILPISRADKITAEPAIDLTLSDALNKPDEARPNWSVAIKATTCARRGETLLVYNPYKLNLNFYGSDRFTVSWFKDGRPVRGNSIKLDCVCKGEYVAKVMHNATQREIGTASFSSRNCYIEAHETVLSDTN